MVGELASKPPFEGQIVEGLIVEERGTKLLMSPADLEHFTGLKPIQIVHKQVLLSTPLHSTGCHEVSADDPVLGLDGVPQISPGSSVRRNSVRGERHRESRQHERHDFYREPRPHLTRRGDFRFAPRAVAASQREAEFWTEAEAHVLLEWKSGELSDTLADAVVVTILQVECTSGYVCCTDLSI